MGVAADQRRNWTDAEKDFLRANGSKMPKSELMAKLGHTEKAIERMAGELRVGGLYSHTPRHWETRPRGPVASRENKREAIALVRAAWSRSKLPAAMLAQKAGLNSSTVRCYLSPSARYIPARAYLRIGHALGLPDKQLATAWILTFGRIVVEAVGVGEWDTVSRAISDYLWQRENGKGTE